MDMKDQRIELRLPQQQLEELDNFISNIDGQYKPSRSDVLRTFIAQGIRGKFTLASQEVARPSSLKGWNSWSKVAVSTCVEP
ncbi:hypothetical protein [Serratia sp. Z4]|uniref:hypothetical protein n=1 Tax=Serratia sp. Z4 TaxID=2738127 RepID=UPI0013567F05|nr:hypothetical protein [Serratia sp. Z4]